MFIMVMHRCSKNRPEHSQLHMTEEQYRNEKQRGRKKEDKNDNEEAILVQTKRKNTLKICYVGFTLT